MTATVVAPAREVREWAASQSIEFPKRGRLPQELLQKYAAAHPNTVEVVSEIVEPPVIPSGEPKKLGRPRKAQNVDPKTARAWLQENGFETAERGRIPAELMRKYAEANNIVLAASQSMPTAQVSIRNGVKPAAEPVTTKHVTDARTKIYVITSSTGVEVIAEGPDNVLVERIDLTNTTVKAMLDSIERVRMLAPSSQRSAILTKLAAELSFVVTT